MPEEYIRPRGPLNKSQRLIFELLIHKLLDTIPGARDKAAGLLKKASHEALTSHVRADLLEVSDLCRDGVPEGARLESTLLQRAMEAVSFDYGRAPNTPEPERLFFPVGAIPSIADTGDARKVVDYYLEQYKQTELLYGDIGPFVRCFAKTKDGIKSIYGAFGTARASDDTYEWNISFLIDEVLMNKLEKPILVYRTDAVTKGDWQLYIRLCRLQPGQHIRFFVNRYPKRDAASNTKYDQEEYSWRGIVQEDGIRRLSVAEYEASWARSRPRVEF